MSFVDKRPSRIQGQVFFVVVVGEVKQDGQRYSVRSEKQKLNLFLSGAAPDVAGRGSRTLSQPRPVPEKFPKSSLTEEAYRRPKRRNTARSLAPLLRSRSSLMFTHRGGPGRRWRIAMKTQGNSHQMKKGIIM